MRPGTTRDLDPTPKDLHRDKLAADLARYLERGGSVKQLPGPGNGISNRIGHGRSAVLVTIGG